jgi:hypothetical protein
MDEKSSDKKHEEYQCGENNEIQVLDIDEQGLIKKIKHLPKKESK